MLNALLKKISFLKTKFSFGYILYMIEDLNIFVCTLNTHFSAGSRDSNLFRAVTAQLGVLYFCAST